MFEVLVAVCAFAGGVIASLAGFGIGSLITPILAARYGMKLAVAMVAIPHVAGTALRFWFLRKSLDRSVLMTFGVTSALGGLTGAVLHSWIGGRFLAYILAALLIFAGVTGLAARCSGSTCRKKRSLRRRLRSRCSSTARACRSISTPKAMR
jgi:uncharacterized membrane protein YfcA